MQINTLKAPKQGQAIPSHIKGKSTKCYDAWMHMHDRCYRYPEKYPTYKDCAICSDWFDFQNFAQWYALNHREGFHLDKDILVKGNKEYCPERCIFVPQQINKLFNDSKNSRGVLPQGVYSIYNPTLRFMVQLSKWGKRVYVASFNTIPEAKAVYKIEKEKYVKEVAKEHFKLKNIDLLTYEALLKWEL